MKAEIILCLFHFVINNSKNWHYFGLAVLQKPLSMKSIALLLALLVSISYTASAQKIGTKTGTTGSSGSTTTTTTGTTGTSTTTGGTKTGTTKTGTGVVTDVINTVTGGGSGTGNFTQTEAANAIKEALTKGITAGVNKVSVTDGYFKNTAIKIPFPTQVKTIENTLRSVGMGSLVDNFVKSINRAAESSAKQAGPIFVNAITKMTINDAINIVGNQQPDAATRFLERTTTEQLVTSFKPSIKTALDKSLATKYWKDITTYYNKIPFVSKVSTDLPDYVTRKAISGLFYMVAQEEAKIRKDPAARTTDILQKVFGGIFK